MLDAYEVDGGAIQVDTQSGSYVFGPSPFSRGATVVIEAHPSRDGADEAAAAFRASHSAFPWELRA